MPTFDCDGQIVQTDDDGFLLDGSRWTREVAEHLARDAGLRLQVGQQHLQRRRRASVRVRTDQLERQPDAGPVREWSKQNHPETEPEDQ